MIERTYKYRIYPNDKQKRSMTQISETARALYNMMLSDRTQHYRKTGTWKRLDPEPFIKGSLYMKDLDPTVLNWTVTSLEKTYANFFNYKNTKLDRYRPESLKRKDENPTYNLTDADLVGYPKPKQNGNKESWNIGAGNVLIVSEKLTLPGVGTMKIRIHRPIPEQSKISHFTVIKKASGNYYLLVNLQLPDVPVKPQIDTAVGIALEPGMPFYCSDGYPVRIRHQTPAQSEKMAMEYEKLTKKMPGSRRYEKQRQRLASLYEKRVNQRRDSLQKAAAMIVSKADFVIIEEPAVMRKKRKLLRENSFQTVADEAWWTFSEYLRYKTQGGGKRFWRAPEALPVRDTCSACGIIVENRERTALWSCPYCGAELPAALNAARNLEILGMLHIEGEQKLEQQST